MYGRADRTHGCRSFFCLARCVRMIGYEPVDEDGVYPVAIRWSVPFLSAGLRARGFQQHRPSRYCRDVRGGKEDAWQGEVLFTY